MTWRTAGHRTGKMRERITVQQATETTSDAGDVTRAWSNLLTNEPAAVEYPSGGETLRGKQVDAGVTAVFTVHYRSAYVPTLRVVHSGTTYGIVFVQPIEGGRRYIDLHCKS